MEKANTEGSETRKLGCGDAYKGGRCVSGDDVTNCIFLDYHDP